MNQRSKSIGWRLAWASRRRKSTSTKSGVVPVPTSDQLDGMPFAGAYGVAPED